MSNALTDASSIEPFPPRDGSSRAGQWRRYLDLIFYKAYADLRKESERTYIGYLWWIIDPVVNMVVYYTVFSVFLDRGGADYAPFLLIGLISWRWLLTVVRVGASSILVSAGLMRQVFVPKIVFPTIAALTSTFKFLFALTLLLLFLWIYGFSITPAYIALPALLVIQFVFILSIAYVLAAIVPLLPDLRVLIDNGLTFLFFLSGIFYSGASLSPQHQRYFYLNPIAHIIENYRTILIAGEWPNWRPLLVILISSLAAIGFGAFLIFRWDRHYPRVVR